MNKLWDKGFETAKEVERFTIGNDATLDMYIAKYDVLGSLAHTTMLNKIGLLTDNELIIVHKELKNILGEIEEGKFTIQEGVEDIHSQVELILTEKIGELGKKIHAGRSRNDQVLTDIKLYLKDACKEIAQKVNALFYVLLEKSEEYKDIFMPGYTHEQLAMPSSFGLWLGSHAEGLIDDIYMLEGAYKVCDSNPLGSAAGYGNSFPLDRELTTKLLGFSTLTYNSIAAQSSRGKCEKAVAMAMAQIAATLNKLSADCCMFICQNFGFISFPKQYTTGSSIMPHKKNPDVWELIRAKCNIIESVPTQISMLCTNLEHGYHRDFQLLKELLFPQITTLLDCLNMAREMISHIEVNKNLKENPLYDCIFTVEEVNHLVLEQGIPFREAYRIVAKEVEDGSFIATKEVHHTHFGSICNLCNEKIKEKMEFAISRFE